MIVLFLILVALGEAVSGIIQFLLLDFPRARGTFFNPNYYGLFLALSAIIIISGFLFSDKKKFEKNKSLLRIFSSSLFLYVSLFSIIAGLLFSASKGVSICFLLTLLIMLIVRFKIKGLSVFILIIAVIILIPNPLSDRFEIALHYDILGFSRPNIWHSAVNMFLDNPIGIGPAMFKYYFYQYNFPVKEAVAFYGNHATNAHNEYLQFIAEGGIPGIIIAALLLLFISYRLSGGIKKKKLFLRGNNSTGFIFSILMILLHSTVDSSLHDYTSAVIFSLFAGIIAGETEKTDFSLSFKISTIFPCIITVTALSLGMISLILFTGQYYANKGINENKSLEYEKAEKSLSNSIYFTPFNPSSFNVRANVKVNRYIKSGMIEELESAFLDESNALSLNTMNPFYPYYCGKILKMIFSKTGNPIYLEKSFLFFKDAVKINPYNPFYRLETALIYIETGKTNDAEKALEEIVGKEPFFLPAYELLYRICSEDEKNDMIIKLSEKIKELELKRKKIRNLTIYEMSFTKLSKKINREILREQRMEEIR